MTEYSVLEEFVTDIEAAYGSEAGDSIELLADWPDLALTYKKAKAALKLAMQMRPDSDDPLKIVEWISTGNISEEPVNVRNLLDLAGECLDAAYSSEIFGEVVFRCEDNQIYMLAVEGVIGEINPEYLQQVLEEKADVLDDEEN